MNKVVRINREKVIVSGDRVRLYQYDRAALRVRFDSPVSRRSAGQTGDKLDNNVYRARRAVRYLLECNARPRHSWFLTLTFHDNVLDWDTAVGVWTAFSRRLGRVFGPDVGYIAVPERQSRGSWHVHCVLVNAPSWIDFSVHNERLLSMWRDSGFGGSCNYSRVKNNKAIGCYVSKYITKEMMKDVPFNKRSYFCSRNLKRPSVYLDAEIGEIRKRMVKLNKSKKPDFETEFVSRDGRKCKMSYFRKATVTQVL